MAIKKLYDVTGFDGQNIAVLRTILDRVSQDSLTFKFTKVLPTVNNVAANEVVLYDAGGTLKKVCMKTGEGNLICFYMPSLLAPGPPVTNVSSGPYTVLDTDYVILVNATSGAITVNLPTAVGREGRIYNIKRINTNANLVTIDGAGAETIDNTATKVLALPYTAATIYSDNANWWII